MDRFIRLFFFIALLAHGSITPCGAQNPVPNPQRMSSGRTNNAPQEMDSSRPPVETAMFEGISPGVTTAAQLNQEWGEPQLESNVGDDVVRLYSRDPLNHIEVTLRGGIVRSIVIQFDTPYPEEDVRSSLQEELLWSKPVLVPSKSGGYEGELFPEKGIMFSFAPQTEGSELFVQRVGIDPITADPFVTRAEAILYDQPVEAKRDLLDAVRLKPDHAKAYWLLAQIELWEGHVESALLYNEKAIQLDEQRPSYHLTFVQALIQMNRIDEAKQYLQETIGICERLPHENARALVMLGELYSTCRNPDYGLAYACYQEAINLANALIRHSNQTVRLTAKDVLFNAHLETAKTIARGRWDKKEGAIKQWIDCAKELARDIELAAAQRYSNEYQFKIAACTLATLFAVPELNIDFYIEDVIEAGDKLISAASDPILWAKYHWDTSLALYDVVQIFQSRGQYSSALKYGERAVNYMELGMKTRKSDTDMFLLGRLYFRLGAIHAVSNENHRAAIEWYDLVKPIFEKLLPKIDPGALELFGKAFVSMGVSYWEAGKREEAVRLTELGCRQIERGVRGNVIPASEQMIPYSNLAYMYQELGDQENAIKYARLAESVGNADEKRIR